MLFDIVNKDPAQRCERRVPNILLNLFKGYIMNNNLSYDVYYRKFARIGRKPKGEEFDWTFISSYRSTILSNDHTDLGYLRARSRVLEEIMSYNRLWHDSGWEFQFKIVNSINYFKAGKDQNVILKDNKVDEMSEDDKEWEEFFYWIDIK